MTYCFIFFLWWFTQSRFWSINSKNVSKPLSIEISNHIVVLNVFHCPLRASLTNLKCLHNSLSNCSSDMLWIELPLMLTNMLCHQHTSPKSVPWQTQCVIVLPEQGKLQLVWIDPSRHLLLLYISPRSSSITNVTNYWSLNSGLHGCYNNGVVLGILVDIVQHH